ncbi:hypothetical transposase [Nitrococcus mobilis Nb-231]|uniref:Hypothetical transposase n=1 Tax=Nitrococcus mobilis Nb-231 TaxID=314278 RepID=A4BLU3_9GAMM|nr:hypothetical transposase [Nitrococcus mobilis Nb-231]
MVRYPAPLESQAMGDWDGIYRLSGLVELDEAFIGGRRPGKRGRDAAGKTPMLWVLSAAPMLWRHMTAPAPWSKRQPGTGACRNRLARRAPCQKARCAGGRQGATRSAHLGSTRLAAP